MKILSNNKRCITILDSKNNYIIKHYYSNHSYFTEKEFYEKMNGKPYIPKLIKVDDMEITIEYLGDNSLDKYLMNNAIPIDLAKQFYDIFIDMLNCGFDSPSEHGFSGKFEHVFINDTIEPFKMGRVKMIDFDVMYTILPQSKDASKEYIDNKFRFLFNKNDSSLDLLREDLLENGVENIKIDDFIKQFK